MSATFVTELFPDLAGVMKQHMPEIWANLFPPVLQDACPLQKANYFGEQLLSMPTLIPIALGGIMVGLKGWRSSSHSLMYQRAFWYFGCMNFSAIICHCLISYDSFLKPWAWGLDVGFTCASSMFLVAAAISGRHSSTDKLLHQHIPRLPLPLLLLAVYSNLQKWPWLNEVMYIGVTGLAVVTLLCCEVAKPSPRRNKGRGWIWGCTASALLALNAIPWDGLFCITFGSYFNHVHMLFAACVAAFFCLDQYLAANEKLKSS
jgi:hypothetical protein